MARSLIYTYNPTGGAVAAGGVVPMGGTGAIVRRYGGCVNAGQNGITLSGEGYYTVAPVVTAVAAAAGPISATLYQDGTPVPGAVVTATATAGGTVTLAVPPSAVRVRCSGAQSVLTVVLSAAATASTISALVTKE